MSKKGIKVFKPKRRKKSKGENMKSIDDKISKNLIFSDIHIPYQDDNAVNVVFNYGKYYKPNKVIINGDLLDFYRLSHFDQTPERRDSFPEEVEKGKEFLRKVRKTFKDSDIYFLEGNHENRLQRYLWSKAPEFYGLESLDLKNMLEFEKLKIKHVQVDGDYWAKDTGHLKIGDLIVMHGDSRLNGASTSKYSGYSAKNTMMGIQSSVAMGHVHRLALIHHRTPYGQLVGIEGGCLSQIPGNANWQQGFVTFETYRGKNVNYRIHQINEGKLFEDGKLYK